MSIDHNCEDFVIDRCLVCGAPQCCAICCQENSLQMAEDDLRTVRAENTSLMKGIGTVVDWCNGNIQSKSQVSPFCVQVRNVLEGCSSVGQSSEPYKPLVAGSSPVTPTTKRERGGPMSQTDKDEALCENCGEQPGYQGFMEDGKVYCCPSCYDEANDNG